jgi:hypothetical protein
METMSARFAEQNGKRYPIVRYLLMPLMEELELSKVNLASKMSFHGRQEATWDPLRQMSHHGRQEAMWDPLVSLRVTYPRLCKFTRAPKKLSLTFHSRSNMIAGNPIYSSIYLG